MLMTLLAQLALETGRTGGIEAAKQQLLADPRLLRSEPKRRQLLADLLGQEGIACLWADEEDQVADHEYAAAADAQNSPASSPVSKPWARAHTHAPTTS